MPDTEARDLLLNGAGGRGAFHDQRSRLGTGGGGHGSEDAGISSEKTGENPVRRKPKVSSGRLVLWRLVGPKPNPYGVGDGWPVDIPAPALSVMSEGGTRHDTYRPGLEVRVQRQPCQAGKSAWQ